MFTVYFFTGIYFLVSLISCVVRLCVTQFFTISDLEMVIKSVDDTEDFMRTILLCGLAHALCSTFNKCLNRRGSRESEQISGIMEYVDNVDAWL